MKWFIYIIIFLSVVIGIYNFVTQISLLEWGKVIVFGVYFLGLIWFFEDDKSPISEWTKSYPIISIPAWFFLMIVGSIIIL